MKLKRLIFLILGFLCLGLGCVGVALPILPTVPFFLVTVFCFANSSQKLHDWFVSTKLYKKHLESFVKKKGMTVQTKVGVIIPVTLLMGFGFFMMMRANVVVPSVIWSPTWRVARFSTLCPLSRIPDLEPVSAIIHPSSRRYSTAWLRDTAGKLRMISDERLRPMAVS